MVRGPIGESPSGGDAYEVKLYDAPATSSPTTSTTASSPAPTARRATRSTATGPPTGPELWVMLMEKAWAAQRGGFNNLDFGQASDG